MIILHLVTDKYPPTTGGLEKRTKSLAHKLVQNGFHVFVHILAGEEGLAFYGEHHTAITIRLPYYDNKIIDESIRHSPTSDYLATVEGYRVKYLCLKNQLLKEIRDLPNAEHIIISNFITKAGYISSLVAEELGIQHIASIVGTDFSRGLRNPIERSIIETVLNSASAVVTLNYEFEAIARRMATTNNIFTIHNAVDIGNTFHQKRQERPDAISIISDCGYSHKKGTQILLSAFRQLRKEGVPIHLTICGSTNEGQTYFWNELRTNYLNEFPTCFKSYDYISASDLTDLIKANDIYCSPTLGEGCSNSRIAALCLGIPIVTTRCGEMPDLANDVNHVRLCLPGDSTDFYLTLKQAINDFFLDKLTIDESKIEYWRNYFTASREISQWLQVIYSLKNQSRRKTNIVYARTSNTL